MRNQVRYQSPMGKVKIKDIDERKIIDKYQSPMGKVKASLIDALTLR